MKTFLIRSVKILLAVFVILSVSLAVLFFVVSAPPAEKELQTNVVNDVTTLNPISVSEVYKPTSTTEIISLIKNHTGAVSIGGARHSMGGQIGADKSIHLDMRDFDEIISLDTVKKEITVQPGITWYKIQEYIDPFDLSVSIMQTYANFTVGGSLSVNVHGRYIGQGAIIHSVKSLKIVLADGTLLQCSREENAELFYGCIGGMGGLGVIVEATLKLSENCKVERRSQTMPLSSYKDFFKQHIRNDTSIVFHNADIYPDEYEEVRAVTYTKTERPVTTDERLISLNKDYRFERFGMWVVSEMYGGKWLRQHLVDPSYYESEKIVWRNYEASYDAMELEPSSRNKYTYVLQEYFIPIDRIDSFVPVMASIFKQHKVNVINISIRHANRDKESLMSWSPNEVFCFVVYYKQGTSTRSKEQVGVWTRELIDAAILNGGSYYLPYQLHATQAQFSKAYPNADEFFNLKTKVDPDNKFRNKLWDKYYVPDSSNAMHNVVP